jgi:NADH dehydrogenase [ubiquinone] 1 alpha subcomplex assembly factor 6
MQELVNYSEESVSSLLYLALECTGVRDDDADTVASHAGVGIGLTTALRGLPFRVLHGEVPIPRELLPRTFAYDELTSYRSVDDYSTFTLSEEHAQVLQEAVRHMAYAATSELARARDMQGKVPKAGKLCLLPVIPSIHYLRQLEQVNYNLFDPKLVGSSSRLPVLLMLARTWLTGVF